MRKMNENAKSKGKTLAKDQANFFLRLVKKMSWGVAPKRDVFDVLLERFGGRLKRKKGVSPQKEVERRRRARGAFARRWKISKVESEPYRIRIFISNFISYAGKLEGKNHLAERAAGIVGSSFKRKLNRLADQLTKGF